MSFNEEVKLVIWKRAICEEGFDPDKYRKDPCGAWMIFDEHGNNNSIFGWEIDHICPRSFLEEKGINSEKMDDINNLRAMQWENNNAKGNDYPEYHSVVSSEDNKNVYIGKLLTINAEIQKTLQQLYQL